MQLNIVRIRLGAAIAGILVVGIYLMGGGSLTPGSKSAILIQFGMYPEVFEGCDVLIDGEVVGTLRRVGANCQNGFSVKDGEHTVEIRHAEIGCRPAKVTTGAGASHVMLIADFTDVYRDGKSESVISLGY
jgi:hypothetical protein